MGQQAEEFVVLSHLCALHVAQLAVVRMLAAELPLLVHSDLVQRLRANVREDDRSGAHRDDAFVKLRAIRHTRLPVLDMRLPVLVTERIEVEQRILAEFELLQFVVDLETQLLHRVHLTLAHASSVGETVALVHEAVALDLEHILGVRQGIDLSERRQLRLRLAPQRRH